MRLPPLEERAASQSYRLTGGTFTLNSSPARGGVATFEFESLPQGETLLPPLPPATFEQEQKQKPAAATTPGGKIAKDTDLPPANAKASP
eukprot:COSAG02_NODE_39079_length_421_cov_0.962733_1_plen_89_part_10